MQHAAPLAAFAVPGAAPQAALEDTAAAAPFITDDAVVLGLLAATLGLVFWTSQSAHPFWRAFYKFVPALLLCYFVPAIYNSTGLIDGEASRLYHVASRYLLPATLALLCVAVDFKGIARLGPKALILFFTGTVGVVLGGPIAMFLVGLVSPETVGGETWRGFTAVAGSWIGGSANQAAMKEAFEIPPELFGMMVAVDVLVASTWMAVLLWMAANAKRLDAARGADTRAIEELRERVERFESQHTKNPSLADLMLVVAVGFGTMGLSHYIAAPIAAWFTEHAPHLEIYSLTSTFVWIVVIATILGLLLALTPARRLEGVGASKVASVLLYLLVATIGMQMDIRSVFENPGLFVVGFVWIAFHGALLFVVAKLIKAPTFFIAVGSMANIGGAASAPAVASAFHPTLAPVGVLLAVLGYAIGTFGGWVSGMLMRWVAS
jgi:uncharacterized membrane protein